MKAFKVSGIRTSVVHAPEFDGWKKLSVDAISLARESKAFDPARYVFPLDGAVFPSGTERNSFKVLD